MNKIGMYKYLHSVAYTNLKSVGTLWIHNLCILQSIMWCLLIFHLDVFPFLSVTNTSSNYILSVLVWTERKNGGGHGPKRFFMHFLYIGSGFKAFQNICSMFVSCSWFTGHDRKSISVPVDAKFITLPQNSDSLLLLELQLAAMATNTRQYFPPTFFHCHSCILQQK